MGEYEELCERFGLDPSSGDDYERLTDVLVGGGSERPEPADWPGTEKRELLFATFQEACEWSKAQGGKPFTRCADGSHFAPVGSECASPREDGLAEGQSGLASIGPVEVSRAEVLAFLEGRAAPGSDWLPGTWMGLNHTGPNPSTRDYHMEKRHFLPRLTALAPAIARQWRSGRHGTTGFFTMMSNRFHAQQSSRQLSELLRLLEGRLVRARRWYATQAAARGEMKAYENIPSPFLPSGMFHAHKKQYGETPQELVFWLGAIESVRKEVERRSESQSP